MMQLGYRPQLRMPMQMPVPPPGIPPLSMPPPPIGLPPPGIIINQQPPNINPAGGPVLPPPQMMMLPTEVGFDGKMLRKTITRKTVDYNPSCVKYLEVCAKI